MRHVVIVAAMVAMLAGCEERRVISDDSATAKFTRMMGGKAEGGGETEGGWQIARNDQTKPVRRQNDPEVRVIHEADFSGYKFSTNLQVDDGRGKAGSATQPAGNGAVPAGAPAGPSSNQPLVTPFVLPMQPGGGVP